MQVKIPKTNLSSLPTVATAITQLRTGTSKAISVVVELYDYGVATGWARRGVDLRGRAFLGDSLIVATVNPSRDWLARYLPEQVARHTRQRPEGLPRRVSLKALNAAIDDAMEAALEAARAQGLRPLS